MRTETITFLKKNAADLPVENSPLTITQNGTPAYVIESAKEYEKRQETMAMLKLLAFSAQDKKQERVLSKDELMGRIKKRKVALQL